MPPFKLRIRCSVCSYRLTGWYPGILMKADKHAGEQRHAVNVFRLDGKSYCTIPVPKLEESW